MSNIHPIVFSESERNSLYSILHNLAYNLDRFMSTRICKSKQSTKDILFSFDATSNNDDFSSKLKQYIYNLIESNISKEISIFIENNPTPFEPSEIVTKVYKSIMDSAEFYYINNLLHTEFTKTLQYFIDDFELLSLETSFSFAMDRDNFNTDSPSGPLAISHLTSDYLNDLMQRFSCSESGNYAVRRESFQFILQFSTSELLSCPLWPTMHTQLVKSLGDEDKTVSAYSFVLILRLFSTNSVTSLKESYIILVEHLMEYFMSIESNELVSLDLRDDVINSIFQKFNLLMEYINQLPTFWLRLNNAIMHEIINKTVQLFSFRISYINNSWNSSAKPNSLVPLHIMSLIDCKMNWFHTLFHSQYSRNFIISCLEENSIFMDSIIQFVMSYSEKGEAISLQKNSIYDQYIYDYNALQYVLFIASLHIIENICIFSSITDLQHNLENKLTSPYQVFPYLYLKVLTSYSIYNTNTLELEPYYIVLSSIKKFIIRSSIHLMLSHNGIVIYALINQLSDIFINADQIHTPSPHLILILDIMRLITQDSHLQSAFINTKSFFHSHENFVKLLYFIKQAVKLILNSKIFIQSLQLFLQPLTNILSTCEGAIQSENLDLISYLNSLLDTKAVKYNICYRNEIFSCLSSLLADPKGLHKILFATKVNKSNISFQEVLNSLFLNCRANYNCNRFNSLSYRYLLNHLSCWPSVTQAVANSGISFNIVNNIRHLLDFKHKQILSQQSSILSPLHKDIQKACLDVCTIYCNYSAFLSSSIDEFFALDIIQFFQDYLLKTTPEKLSRIFNYEETHIVILNLLNIALCSLNTFLLFEEHFNITDLLLKLQKLNILEDGREIFDQTTAERISILLRISVIGGPGEKMHFPDTLFTYHTISTHNPLPIFTALPLQKCYLTFKQFNYASQNLSNVNLTKEEIKSNLYSKITSPTESILLSVLSLLICYSATDHYFSMQTQNHINTNLKVNPTHGESIAIKLIVEYGVNIGLIKNNINCNNNLSLLLGNVKNLLSESETNNFEQLISNKFSMHNCDFDWFSSILYILFCGDINKCFKFLQDFSSSLSSAYIWPNRLLNSKLFKNISTNNSYNLAEINISQYLQLIIKNELPKLYSAFCIAGICLTSLALHWIKQCFLNYLDIEEICNYVLLCVYFGSDYVIYFIAAILKHCEYDILSYTQDGYLLWYLREQPIKGFKTSNYMLLMSSMEKKWRSNLGSNFLSLQDF